jgi:hypothetical protein
MVTMSAIASEEESSGKAEPCTSEIEARTIKHTRRGGVTKPQFALEIQRAARASMRSQGGGNAKPQSVMEFPRGIITEQENEKRVMKAKTQTVSAVRMQGGQAGIHNRQ